jgi:hypothetical protein
VALAIKTTVLIESVKTSTEGSATGRDEFLLTDRLSWTDGTGASAANKQWNDYRTLGGSADSLDLAGSLANRIGETASFTKVRLFAFKADSTNAGNLTVGGGSNAWAAAFGTLTAAPGSLYFLKCPTTAGWAVTAGTGDICQVSGTSGDKYEIYFAGE